MLKKNFIIKNVKDKLTSENFICYHKYHETYFTRLRKLSFIDTFMLILKNSIKSLQLRLNEYVLQSKLDYTITNSAFTQARQKFSYTAFKELDADTVSIYYRNDDYKTLFGFRCIAADGSVIILPKNDETIKEFGTTPVKNKHSTDSYVSAKWECYYDILNNITIKSQLAHGSSYEVDLALNMVEDFTAKDLLIYDRGYASYKMIATLTHEYKNYLIRLPKQTFKVAKELFDSKDSSCSKIVTLKAPTDFPRDTHLPLKIKVRLIKLQLSTGETEVLATSIMDPEIIVKDFGMLYGLRWGIETFFGTIKGRLNLRPFNREVQLENQKNPLQLLVY